MVKEEQSVMVLKLFRVVFSAPPTSDGCATWTPICTKLMAITAKPKKQRKVISAHSYQGTEARVLRFLQHQR